MRTLQPTNQGDNMKRLIPALAIMAVALTGCDSGATSVDTGEPTTLYERHITLEDGREVTCIIHSRSYQGGVSCDWDNAR